MDIVVVFPIVMVMLVMMVMSPARPSASMSKGSLPAGRKRLTRPGNSGPISC